MIKLENPLGIIEISHEYFSNLVGRCVTSCYGVAGMAANGAAQGIRSWFGRRDPIDRGVRVRVEQGQLVIDLHIIVTYGVNISAIVKSIVNKVRYTVEEVTGFSVGKVNVFVDGMRSE